MPTPARAWWRLVTPPPVGLGGAVLSGGGEGGAIAAVAVGGDVERAVGALGIRPPESGGLVLRTIPGVDEVVVARFGPDAAWVMPHAGPAVLRSIMARLVAAGVKEAGAGLDDAAARFPEAGSKVGARALAALAAARSPLAVDLLLDQERRWAGVARDGVEDATDLTDPARDARLRRLIEPPLVVALGRPNIGKSSLLNALAGRGVAIEADEPGTTRDHVGASLELAGLVVRYIDTPGLEAGAGGERGPLAAAQGLARRAAAGADLVLWCGDPVGGFLPEGEAPPGVPRLPVLLRADLAPAGVATDEPGAVRVSVRRRTGIEDLVRAVREALVPEADLLHPGPWRFWE